MASSQRGPDDVRRLLEKLARATVPSPSEPSERARPGDVEPPTERTLSDVRYLDEGEIGRGGMGHVHIVRDGQLLRRVAMKYLDEAMSLGPRYVASFVQEAQVTAQLDHPHIVPVHELGIDASGTPYFTMKLVRGRSLFDWLSDEARPAGSSERLADGLDVFLKVCDAMSFAHSRGVVHRDLKPENIMVGEFGEVYVMDWGLARLLTSEVEVSGGRDAANALDGPGPLGTPAYMSPEGALGAAAEQDERTDVFGLGAVLYMIVTGKLPYGDGDVTAILAAAKRGAVTPPEDALAGVGVSKKLLRIVRKALAPAREHRYQSVAELKADVQHFLRGGLHLPRAAFPPGTRIVVEGDVGDAAYIIVKGQCEAYKTKDGQRVVLRRMGPGEVFGETAVLSALPRTATVEAIDTVTALVVTRAELEEGLGLDSWLGTLVRALALRFRELDERIDAAR